MLENQPIPLLLNLMRLQGFGPPALSLLEMFPMFALCSTACMRAKAFLFLFVLVSACGMAFAQDSFMVRFSPSALDASLINRGDFNNDGIPDIVTGNNAGANGFGLTVHLGNSDGTFQAGKNTSAAISPVDIAVGDFNGDGKLDVALAAYDGATQEVLQVMLGNGDGTFTKGQTINLSSIPGAITTGDFDNDGQLDLALTLDKIYFYRGVGDGRFSAAGALHVGTLQPPLAHLRVGNFNGDG